MRSAPAIAFDYRPSRTVVAVTLCVAIAATAAPWLSAASTPLRAALSAIVWIGVAIAIRRFVGAKYRRIAYGAAGWRLIDAVAEPHVADLVAQRRVGAWLALDFRVDGGGRFRTLLGPDNLDADTRRRLVLLLARAEVARAG